jgi:ribonuclease HI
MVWMEVKAMNEDSKKKLIRIFTDGAGQGPDGMGSGFAWLREDTGEKCIQRIPGLSNNVAEYQAVIAALKPLKPGSHIEVLTDSLLVVSQLRGEYRILDPKLAKLATEVKTIAERKRLFLKLTWISRRDNRAGKLI